MLGEHQIGRISDRPLFGIKRESKVIENHILRQQNIGFAVFTESETVAYIDISYLTSLRSDEFKVSDGQRHAPIMVRLLQFDSKKDDVLWDDYFLGRKQFSEAYGGELWLHRSKTTNRSFQEPWQIDKTNGIGDIAKYRSSIERVLHRVPWGNKWHALNDVLSFIDGMTD